MTTAVIFDDNRTTLGPLTDLRPSFLVRTGALTTLDRIAFVLKSMKQIEVESVWTATGLEPLARERTDLPVNELSGSSEDVLLVNGRAILQPREILELKTGETLVHEIEATVVASRVDRETARNFLLRCHERGAAPSAKQRVCRDECLLLRPWDVIRHRDKAMEIDLESMRSRPTQEIPPGVIAIGVEDITISPEAVIYPTVVLDAGDGPIVIEDDVTIRPGAIIIGPAYIGAGSTIIDRALIKAHTAIGPVCKVAGEVGGTIFQGYSNKAHDGHLGDAWVGEWANFGAGTTNSNLLNTYDEIVAQAAHDSPREKTGLRFYGGVVGDHVKFAICSRIMTGSVFGTGAMIATTAPPPTAVPRFAWLTDDRPVGAHFYRLNKFLDVAAIVMERRGRSPSAAYLERLSQLHRETKAGK